MYSEEEFIEDTWYPEGEPADEYASSEDGSFDAEYMSPQDDEDDEVPYQEDDLSEDAQYQGGDYGEDAPPQDGDSSEDAPSKADGLGEEVLSQDGEFYENAPPQDDGFAIEHTSPQDGLFVIKDTSPLPNYVPLQCQYMGEKPVITSTLADLPSATLGVEGLLNELNTLMKTSYTLYEPNLLTLLQLCITEQFDFGMAYSYLRAQWDWAMRIGSFDGISAAFSNAKQKDADTRTAAVSDNEITNSRLDPRRLWDLYSNRVVPAWLANPYPVGTHALQRRSELDIFAISHAWVRPEEREFIMTPINGYAWPVPVPVNTTLGRVRMEMLNLGAEYAWLDILCLRQAYPDSEESEHLRAQEWAIDVPTIGGLYRAHNASREVVYYLCGLGLPFTLQAPLDDERHWLNRAWTLQEARPFAIVAGDVKGNQHRINEFLEYLQQPENIRNAQEWAYVDRLRSSMSEIRELLRVTVQTITIFGLIEEMRRRFATKEIDKIAGLAYLLGTTRIPSYYESDSAEDAWLALVVALSQNMSREHVWDLAFLYPAPGDSVYKWLPSWEHFTENPIYMQPISLQDVEPSRIGPVFLGLETPIQERWRVTGRCILGPFHLMGLSDPDETDPAGTAGVIQFYDQEYNNAQEYPVFASHDYPIPDGAEYVLVTTEPFHHSYRPNPPRPKSCRWMVGHLLWTRDGDGPSCCVQKVSVLEMDQGVVDQLDAVGLVQHDLLVYFA